MAERIFFLDHTESRLDAATTRRQFSLSLVVAFAVLAAAALVELQPAHPAPTGGGVRHDHVVQTEFAVAEPSSLRS